MPGSDDQPNQIGCLRAVGATERVIIAIDGPAGTGKSSVARDLASAIGLEFLDTGSMYRAASALAIDHGLNFEDGELISDLVRRADLRFDWTTDPPTLYVFGEPMIGRLREQDVSTAVSPISQLAEVRAVLVEKQRRIGEVHPRLVSEGRDQGSVVFFDADVKFYLDASVAIRAERRAEQLRAAGRPVDLREVEREIRERDLRDTSRRIGPLVCPDDAVVVRTDELTQAEVVEELCRIVRERVPAERLAEAVGVSNGG
ncbi:MAG: (d)CMP kinase [Phycisphaerales bacterium]